MNSTVESITTSQSRSFSKHWTTLEEVQLCTSWMAISGEATVGTGQKGEAMWMRILNDFNENTKGRKNRTAKSLENHWAVIQRSVSKFCGKLSFVNRNNPSGYTDADKLKKAKELFESEYLQQFKFSECFDILQDKAKWTNYLEEKDKVKSKKRKLVSVESETDVSSHVAVEECPRGHKAEKAEEQKKRKLQDLEDQLEEINKYDQEMDKKKLEGVLEITEVIKQNATATLLASESAIMAVDPETITNARRKEYYIRMQNNIMDRMGI